MNAEGFYRGLLRVYPRPYRDERGEELLATLLDAEDGAGSPTRRSRAAEAGTILRHGMALRVRTAGLLARHRLPALGLAGVALAVILGVLGSGLHGFPAEWGVYVRWVDPRWPVHAAWVVVALCLLARWPRAAPRPQAPPPTPASPTPGAPGWTPSTWPPRRPSRSGS